MMTDVVALSFIWLPSNHDQCGSFVLPSNHDLSSWLDWSTVSVVWELYIVAFAKPQYNLHIICVVHFIICLCFSMKKFKKDQCPERFCLIRLVSELDTLLAAGMDSYALANNVHSVDILCMDMEFMWRQSLQLRQFQKFLWVSWQWDNCCGSCLGVSSF